MVAAKATTQTDARCYLAKLLTKAAWVSVGDKDCSVRLVGEQHHLFRRNFNEINRRPEGPGDDKTWTHKMTLWDIGHGIDVNER